MKRIACALLLCAGVANAGELDRWYTLSLNGAVSGFQHMRMTTSEGLVTSTATESMTLSRAGVVTTVESSVVWVETKAGIPRSMTWVQTLGGPPLKTTWTFNDDLIDITIEQDGRSQHDQVANPTTPWLGPAAAHRYLQEQAAAGARSATYHVILPDLGLRPVKKHLTLLGPDTVDGPDGPIAVTRWKDETQGIPMDVVVWMDGDMVPARTDMSAPFGRIEALVSTRAAVMRQPTDEVPELFVRMFIEPQGDLGQQVRARRAFLRLRRRDEKPLEIPASGAQTIAGQSDNGVLVMVERSGSLPPLPGDRVDPAYLEPSALIDSTDEAVIERRDAAVTAAEHSSAARAEAMRRHVHRWIDDKNLSTAFASASETARSRAGDCSEHGVLLAAMLRADGIRARVASGLVWMDARRAFGWHMWTQALIDGQWVDLDATLPVPFTPGHVLFSTSALATEDGMAQMIEMIDLLGNVDIDVVRVDR